MVIPGSGDLDIWLHSTVDNAQRALKAIKDLGFGSFDISVADLTKEDHVIQFGQPPLRIDLLMSIDGVTFEECYTDRKVMTFVGLSINFIGYHDLVKNKKATGRHRDLDDIENMKPE